MMQAEARLSRPRDAELLRPIIEKCVVDENNNVISDEVDAIVFDVLNAKYSQKIFAVAELGPRLVGTMGIRPPSAEMREFTTTAAPFEIINAFVDPNLRNRGVGQILLSRLLEVANTSGATEIIVNSGPRYKKTGWPFWTKGFGEPITIAKDFYGPSLDAPVWCKKL